MIPVICANKRVLIVDDQRAIHDDFVEILRNPHARPAADDDLVDAFLSDADADDEGVLIGFELLHASSGEQACEIVTRARERDEPVAVAYVDIRMPPGIDGIETVRRIRQMDRAVEIVIMTAYNDRSLHEIVRNVDLPHKLIYIRKPFVHEEIQQLTTSLVGKWNVERSLIEKQGQIAASHRRLEAVLDATGDAIAMLDADGRPLLANALYRELLGLDEEEPEENSADALAARHEERFHEPKLNDVEPRFVIGRGTVVETTGRDGVSKQRLFYRSSSAVRDGDGEVIGMLIAYRDVSKEIEADRLKAEVLRLRSEQEESYSFAGVVGNSPRMREAYALMQAAASDITVLLRGESGTGKELVARSLHCHSARRDGPFVTLDCASIPESLIESELFGHERGAFTGATRQHIGAFEGAHGGTLLLDEIGEMPLALQTRLLRVLQERVVRRVGGKTAVPIDIRVITATNKDLERAVAAGGFREDLFYRISAFPISIPPLRHRREDIPLLARHFLAKHSAPAGKSMDSISTAAMGVLLQYDWPGNVRELDNSVQRAVLLGSGSVLQAGDLPPACTRDTAPTATAQGDEVLTLAQVERQAIARALELANHNVTSAARALGISRATVHRKLVKYGLNRGENSVEGGR